MARQGRYDDLSDNSYSRKAAPSSRILFAVIILSVLVCAMAVLFWVKILESSEAVQEASAKPAAAETRQAEAPAEAEKAAPETEKNDEPVLSIDQGLSALGSSSVASSDIDFISSGDYALSGSDQDTQVMEQGIEMKKPLIAQNLSISQQSSFSKDLVGYEQYFIKEGDSIQSIARSFGLNPQTIISVNQITDTASLWIGSALQIPDRDGSLYIVKSGDSLISITRQFGLQISPKTLGDINGITEGDLVEGQKIFIPFESLETSGSLYAGEGKQFIMPCEGQITGMYNQRVADPAGKDPVQLDGILISGTPGAAVVASEAGNVVDRGFGEDGYPFLKIMHPDGYTTYYSYLATVLPEISGQVEKGQQIGTLSDLPLFFRIEQGGVAFDPASFF
ncbi:MAG: M23 family metallopeptidase [Spirochaetales bacterium]|nr:M23 family metallopeptidase [Spirochaetales bacterium]